MKIHPDLTEAKRFLSKLDPTADNFVFQVFDDNGDRKDRRLARVIPGALDAVADQLIKYQKAGAGVFVTINRSRNGGRTKKDIIAPRAIFREADEPNLPELPIKPQLIVESSPGKQHEYLLLDNNCNDLDTWEAVMMTMVAVHGSDPNAKDIARVLRLPGFYHQKDPNHPHMVKIIHENGSGRYSMAEIAKVIPPAQKPEKRTAPAGNINNNYAQKALANELTELAGTREGSRNHQLNKAAFSLGQLIAAGELDQGQVETALLSAAAGIGLPASEAKGAIKSGLQAGMKKPRIIPKQNSGSFEPHPENIAAGGESEKKQNEMVLDPADPLNSAQVFVKKRYHREALTTLKYWQNVFYVWDGSCYSLLPMDDIRADLYSFLKGALVVGNKEVGAFRPTRNKVNDVQDALKAAVNLSGAHKNPCWLEKTEKPNAAEIIALENGLLHLPTRKLFPPDPAFFTTSALPFNYEPNAAPPTIWNKFLKSIWPNDPESIKTLQEICGYLLTNDTTQQKIILVVGPKRSGKGTIARVFTALLGQENVAGPTLASLSQQFGLAPLIDKKLAVIADARLSYRADQHAIAERLLAISGEDCLSIPRKYLTDYTAKLSVRFLVLSNELPRLADSSGALASRFVIMTMTNSFFGKEDPALTTKLLAELPGILNWSIEGWQRLQGRGYFIQPASSKEAIQELADLSSPMGAFVRDRCVLDPAAEVDCGRLYTEWRDWCEDQGRDKPGTKQTFGRDLKAAVPALRVTQPRDGDTRLRMYQGITLKSTWHAMARVSDHCTRKPNSSETLYKNHNGVERVPLRASDKKNNIEGEV